LFLSRHEGHFAFLKALQRGMKVDQIQKEIGISASDAESYLFDLEANRFLTVTADGGVKLIVKDGTLSFLFSTFTCCFTAKPTI
jgi:hypothetical protein